MGCAMDRRSVIKGLSAAGALTAAGQFPAPAVGQPSQVLKFVPQANLANFDPIWGTQYVVRNASQLVWDTLYGMGRVDPFLGLVAVVSREPAGHHKLH